jgi:arylsulfatase A-like enzyme
MKEILRHLFKRTFKLFIIIIIIISAICFYYFRTNGKGIIIIVLDSASAAHFSCYGYSINTTPNIDNIANLSYVFENAYATAVYTRTSVASMFISLYPAVHQMFGRDSILPEQAVTLAEVLCQNSFKTAIFSTTFNVSDKSGLSQGFQEVYKYPYDIDPKIITTELIKWLKRNQRNNFFAYVHYRQPHFPFDAPIDYKKKFINPHLSKLLTNKELLRNIYIGKIKFPNPDLINYIQSQYDANLNYIDDALKDLLIYVKKNKKR